MRRSTRWLYYVILLGFLLAACSKESPDDLSYQPGAMPDEIFTDFVSQESDSGRMLWKLTAPRANRFNREKIVRLEQPVIEFYDKVGNLKTTLVSDAGEYLEESRNMLAYGNVVVRSVKGDVLETDSLMWNNAVNKIVSESFVKFTSGTDLVTGYGLECDPDLNSVDIKRNVRATIIGGSGGMK